VSVIEWNRNLNLYQMRILRLVGENAARAFLDYADEFKTASPGSIHGRFRLAHDRVLAAKNCAASTSVGESPPPEFEVVRNTPSRGQYPNVFDYKYVIIPELDNFHFWAMLFWGRLIKLISFHDPECECEACCKRKTKAKQD